MPSATEAALAKLAELRRLHEAATPGDWEAYGPMELHDGAYRYSEVVPHGHRRPLIAETDSEGKVQTGGFTRYEFGDRFEQDAELIAASRNALPDLLGFLEAILPHYGSMRLQLWPEDRAKADDALRRLAGMP